MFSTVKNFLKPYTGTASHMAHWLVADPRGTKYKIDNPEIKNDEAVAIYCVHGTADRSSAFSTLIKRLLPVLNKNVTYIELVAFNKRFQGTDIAAFAEQLKNKIKANPHKKVILMGHSRGGLVAAQCASSLSKEIGVEPLAVFCVSTPWQGSDVAYLPPAYMASTSVRQMQPKSEFLSELNQKIKQSSTQYFYFVGDCDRLVEPDQACINDRNHWKHLTLLDDHNHLSIMTSSRLADSIKKSIDNVIIDNSKKESESKELAPSEREVKPMEEKTDITRFTREGFKNALEKYIINCDAEYKKNVFKMFSEIPTKITAVKKIIEILKLENIEKDTKAEYKHNMNPSVNFTDGELSALNDTQLKAVIRPYADFFPKVLKDQLIDYYKRKEDAQGLINRIRA